MAEPTLGGWLSKWVSEAAKRPVDVPPTVCPCCKLPSRDGRLRACLFVSAAVCLDCLLAWYDGCNSTDQEEVARYSREVCRREPLPLFRGETL